MRGEKPLQACFLYHHVGIFQICNKTSYIRLFYNNKQKGLAKGKKHVYIDYTNPSLDITTKGNDDENDLHTKRRLRRLSCLSFKKRTNR